MTIERRLRGNMNLARTPLCRKPGGQDMISRASTVATALLLLMMASLPARAQQDVADFYKGKTLRIIVGVGVGSGFDINARVLAHYLPAHLPGNPSVIV